MGTEDKPREVVIHQSANRPNLMLGGDRELVLITMMIAAGLAFSLATVWGIGLAIVYWIASIALLQRMGKADPLLRKIYFRHIRYLSFYSAKSGMFAASVETPRTWS
jgi:type IV secretion system protein VirB3